MTLLMPRLPHQAVFSELVSRLLVCVLMVDQETASEELSLVIVDHNADCGHIEDIFNCREFSEHWRGYLYLKLEFRGLSNGNFKIL